MSDAPAASSGTRSPDPVSSEVALVDALQTGDARAFELVIERYHMPLVRFARAYLQDASDAEEAVQETWLALVKGIQRFEGRSSLKTWLFKVLTYQARAISAHSHRSTVFADMTGPLLSGEPFLPDSHRFAGHWAEAVPDWRDTLESSVAEHELLERVETLINALPPRQRAIMVMRDVDNIAPKDICEIMHVTLDTQRVLLHRARTKVREGIAEYLAGE